MGYASAFRIHNSITCDSQAGRSGTTHASAKQKFNSCISTGSQTAAIHRQRSGGTFTSLHPNSLTIGATSLHCSALNSQCRIAKFAHYTDSILTSTGCQAAASADGHGYLSPVRQRINPVTSGNHIVPCDLDGQGHSAGSAADINTCPLWIVVCII